MRNNTSILKHSGFTHPDIVSLVDPLFATRKEGDSVYNINFILSLYPLYAKGEERVVQRSVDRVSQNIRAND